MRKEASEATRKHENFIHQYHLVIQLTLPALRLVRVADFCVMPARTQT